MVNPTCEYVVIGCSHSNLGESAFPLAVVIIEQSGGKSSLRSYSLKGWQSRRKQFPDSLREQVFDFLENLCAYEPGLEAERFFGHLKNLSIGTFRTVATGESNDVDIDTAISTVFDDGLEPILWPDSFDKVAPPAQQRKVKHV